MWKRIAWTREHFVGGLVLNINGAREAKQYAASNGALSMMGKLTGHLRREGELFRWQIQQALRRFAPGVAMVGAFRQEDEAAEWPRLERHCAGSRYGEVLDVLEQVAVARGEQLVLVGDPGCLVTVAERLHAKYALGSAVAVADGMLKAGVTATPVALFGDSAFFHTAIPAICKNHTPKMRCTI